MKRKSADQYLFVADSHIAGDDAAVRFFRFLDEAAQLPPSVGIVFLGDIFELWIALKRYEDDLHIRFTDWCREQSALRDVIFCEGNHEFYQSLRRTACFGTVSRSHIRRGGLLFTHGDRINRRDVPYLFLRIGIRNLFTMLLLFLTGRAFGPALTQRVRLSLKTSNMVNKKHFPESGVLRLMKSAGQKGIREIFIGHFHDRRDFVQDGVRLHALPAFLNTQEIALYDCRSGEYRCAVWQDILKHLNQQQGVD